MTRERPWFDADTGHLLLDEYVADMSSFRRIMEDDFVTDEELRDHALLVTDILRKLEQALEPAQREMATDALCELAVFYAITRVREEQDTGLL